MAKGPACPTQHKHHGVAVVSGPCLPWKRDGALTKTPYCSGYLITNATCQKRRPAIVWCWYDICKSYPKLKICFKDPVFFYGLFTTDFKDSWMRALPYQPFQTPTIGTYVSKKTWCGCLKVLISGKVDFTEQINHVIHTHFKGVSNDSIIEIKNSFFRRSGVLFLAIF